MGVLYDYFAAASDDVAAAVVDRLGGPTAPVHLPPPPKRGAGRSDPNDDVPSAADSYDALSGNGIDPVVKMSKLEELLSGVPYAEIVARPRSGHMLAERDDGERLVLTLSDELLVSLADAETSRLEDVAERWSQTEEFWGQAESSHLAVFLRAASALCRRARDRGERIYCWVSV